MPLKPLHVLVLDDDRSSRELTAAMLHELGVGLVSTAAEGMEGLRQIESSASPANVLMSDLTMPGMDGIEFLRHVATRGYKGDVVLFSGSHRSVLTAAERLAAEHGLNVLDVLEKPVDAERLADVLSRCGQLRPHGLEYAQQPILSLHELCDGITDGCVELHYQPKLSLRTGRTVGVECLARWRHREHGLLPPSAFIEPIEQNDLIDAFTLEVFRLAVTQQRAWLDDGRPLTVNINLSMNNLLRKDLPEILEAMAARAGVSPRGIVLELTESRLISDLKLSLEVLIRLRLRGFGLSIDDFGTGFSGMAALKQLPFSELKIDRSFVHDASKNATARAILRSSASLGRTLEMNVVAEGVETQSDWDTVVAADCDEVQGFFVAKPLAADALQEWFIDR